MKSSMLVYTGHQSMYTVWLSTLACLTMLSGAHDCKEGVPSDSALISQVVLTQSRQKREPNPWAHITHYQRQPLSQCCYGEERRKILLSTALIQLSATQFQYVYLYVFFTTWEFGTQRMCRVRAPSSVCCKCAREKRAADTRIASNFCRPDRCVGLTWPVAGNWRHMTCHMTCR